MDKVKNATELFNQGYLCSQSVFAAFCEDYGIVKDSAEILTQIMKKMEQRESPQL
jgi:hypothetical protein